MADSSREALVKKWTDLFESEVLKYAPATKASDEEVFADIYHSMAHSSMAQTMIQLEHSHAEAIKKEDEIDELVEEWERVCSDSSASHVRETQRREFRRWISTVHEANSEQESEEKSSSSMVRSDSAFAMSSMTSSAKSESFTITLGAQMKAMHNLRLVSADVFADLLKYSDDGLVAVPQRLQTSMGLYSSNLSGIVLLTDDSTMSNESKISTDFGRFCNATTEFHFPTFDQQIESARNCHLDEALCWRRDYRKRNRFWQHEDMGAADDDPDPESPERLRSGDFFTTRHSNLSNVHVVFHMVSDESVFDGQINSRHPVVMGLRNVLKSASMSSVTTLTLPLLLSASMQPCMTPAWCVKRAELVFKCVKGFMMEVASWAGADVKTVQFLVPKDIDHEVFGKLAAMLPTIFRISNPIRA